MVLLLKLTGKWQVAGAECVINLEQLRINSIERRVNICASVVLRYQLAALIFGAQIRGAQLVVGHIGEVHTVPLWVVG